MTPAEATRPAPLAAVRDAGAARALLQHPLRPRILALGAAAARSPTDMARELGEARQKVHYHVGALARAGFLEPAGKRKKRNMTEQRWRATARAYVLAPELLGELGAHALAPGDAASASALMARASRLQHEVGLAMSAASAQGKRLPSLSLSTELRFTSAAQRAAFTTALEDAVTRVVAEHASPAETSDGGAAPGRPYRLVFGCHPIPPGCLDAERAAARAAAPSAHDPATRDHTPPPPAPP